MVARLEADVRGGAARALARRAQRETSACGSPAFRVVALADHVAVGVDEHASDQGVGEDVAPAAVAASANARRMCAESSAVYSALGIRRCRDTTRRKGVYA